jgi:hypothetical protein
MLTIATGDEDGNDADTLRRDPMFKLAMERLPENADLCSQSALSRTESRPDVRCGGGNGSISANSPSVRSKRLIHPDYGESLVSASDQEFTRA